MHARFVCLVVVIPTDRPKSVRSRCVIERFDDVFVLSLKFKFLIVWVLLSPDWVRYFPFSLYNMLIQKYLTECYKDKYHS